MDNTPHPKFILLDMDDLGELIDHLYPVVYAHDDDGKEIVRDSSEN